MVTYEIKVTFKTEGECIYRKNEAEIPRIPYWSRFTEGGRVYGEDYIKVPAELPHKKSAKKSIFIMSAVLSPTNASEWMFRYPNLYHQQANENRLNHVFMGFKHWDALYTLIDYKSEPIEFTHSH